MPDLIIRKQDSTDNPFNILTLNPQDSSCRDQDMRISGIYCYYVAIVLNRFQLLFDAS